MEIETPELLAEKIADWLGIYGGCKNISESDSNCVFDPQKPFCCRIGFVGEIEERIRQCVENEKQLNATGLMHNLTPPTNDTGRKSTMGN
jgi:hypothetical protein